MNVFLIYHNHYYRHDNLLDAVGEGEEGFFCRNGERFLYL